MKNINCKHCQNDCKTIGKNECLKYLAKSNRPEQLKIDIKRAFALGFYEDAKKLQNELDQFYYGYEKK